MPIEKLVEIESNATERNVDFCVDCLIYGEYVPVDGNCFNKREGKCPYFIGIPHEVLIDLKLICSYN